MLLATIMILMLYVTQEYLISQYRNKYDHDCNNNNAIETFNVYHISLDVLSSDVDADDL